MPNKRAKRADYQYLFGVSVNSEIGALRLTKYIEHKHPATAWGDLSAVELARCKREAHTSIQAWMRAVRDERQNGTPIPAAVANNVSWWTGETVAEGSDGEESEDESSASVSGLSGNSEGSDDESSEGSDGNSSDGGGSESSDDNPDGESPVKRANDSAGGSVAKRAKLSKISP